jgi:hypothetical protein
METMPGHHDLGEHLIYRLQGILTVSINHLQGIVTVSAAVEQLCARAPGLRLAVAQSEL